jgi:hypothetical protein
MSRLRSIILPALFALGGMSLWSSSAAAQYVGGGTAYTQGYGSAPGPGYYGSGFAYAPRPAAGFYYSAAPAPYSAAPAPYSAAPAPSFRSSVVVPGGSSGWIDPAPTSFGRPAARHNSGLEPYSLPAEIAEDIAPARAAPRLSPTRYSGWWRGRTWRWKNSH